MSSSKRRNAAPSSAPQPATERRDTVTRGIAFVRVHSTGRRICGERDAWEPSLAARLERLATR